jgi:Domain of unknown function (DUF4157)
VKRRRRATSSSSSLVGRSSVVQAKLVVGPADDEAEREADEVAQRVLAALRADHDVAPAVAAGAGSNRIRRRAGDDPAVAAGAGSNRIRRRAGDDPVAGPLDESTEQAIVHAPGGTPLAASTRTAMETAFGGVDFGAVRLHRNDAADGLNRRLGARAFTAGTDIFVRRAEGDLSAGPGQEVLAHELTHVLQQQGPSVSRIQRKIGLEFEFSNWQTIETKPSQFAAASSMPNPDQTFWGRIAKGKALARGPGYELQADDDPGGGAQSDLEVVTKAFDETPAGRGELRTAMHAIQQTLGNISNNLAGWVGAGHLPRAIDLGINTVKPNSFLYPSGGPQFRAKPQTTIGLRLGKIADLLEDVFAAPVETVAEAGGRRKGRKALTGWDPGAMAAGNIMVIQGSAPAQARQAIAAYTGVNVGAPAQTPELVGLLSLVLAYLRMADQGLVRSYPKTIAPVMARTDFGAMFKLLSPAEKTWYRGQKGQRFYDLAASAPWLAGMGAGDEVFSNQVANPLAGVSDAQGLSRGKWLKGIARGTDYLTGKKFPVKSKREDMQGLGSYGKKTDKVEDNGVISKAPILELRAMPATELAKLDKVADRIFVYAYLANRGGNEKYAQHPLPF